MAVYNSKSLQPMIMNFCCPYRFHGRINIPLIIPKSSQVFEIWVIEILMMLVGVAPHKANSSQELV